MRLWRTNPQTGAHEELDPSTGAPLAQDEGAEQEAASHGQRLGELEDRVAELERVARSNGWTIE